MTTLEDNIDDEDWYSILQVPSAATEEQISQSYRKLARKYHPDRNHDDPKAAAMFLKIKKALDILMNESLRKQYDAKVAVRLMRKKKREEGNASMRKMKDDLEARENAYKRQKLSEEETKRRTEVEIQQMREDSLRKREAQAQKRAAQSEQREAQRDEIRKEEAQFTEKDDGAIRIKWKHKKIEFSKEQLETIFRAFGPIDHLLISTAKKGRAILSFQYVDHARDVMREMSVHNPYGFKMEWASGKEPAPTTTSSSSAAQTNSFEFPGSSTSSSHKASSEPPVSDLDAFEAEVMKKLQEAAKRRKAAAAAATAATTTTV